MRSEAVGLNTGLLVADGTPFLPFLPVDGRDGGRFQSNGVDGTLDPLMEDGNDVPRADANCLASRSS